MDTHGELPIPKEEQKAIQALLSAIEIRAKENIMLRKKLERMVNIAQETS